MAVLAPMPSANVRSAVSVKPGFRRSTLRPNLMSCPSVSIKCTFMGVFYIRRAHIPTPICRELLRVCCESRIYRSRTQLQKAQKSPKRVAKNKSGLAPAVTWVNSGGKPLFLTCSLQLFMCLFVVKESFEPVLKQDQDVVDLIP